MLTKTEWLIEWTNIVNCNGYLCDWTNDAKSVQWLSFLNPSHNQWATNLIQEDHSFNHSSFVFYNHWKWDWSIIWLSVQIKESINQSINTWIDKRCSFYAVNNNYKIIITNKLVLCYKDIVYSIILSISHFLLFLSRECMIEGLNRCLFCMLLSIQVQQTTRQITIAATMKLDMKMDINIVDW